MLGSSRQIPEIVSRRAAENPKTGSIIFYHPKGAHDDQLWALALAAYATKEKEGEHQLFIT